MLGALRHHFPEANIDFVLNERIAPLFEGHPYINRIITFSDKERHAAFTYLKKVWRIVHSTRYDVIIDMRSTMNTLPFALCSLRTPYRIGIRKPYTRLVFNHRFEGCEDNESMLDHNQILLSPLGIQTADQTLKLHITQQEHDAFRQYMQQQGIDFSRPIMLAGVTAKLADKTWAEERMAEVLRRFLQAYPQVQVIFNFAPGKEAENAQRIYKTLDCHPNIFINVEARSARQLAAMAANCTFYFGNEGGGRHIVQAMGRPSLVVCSPMASKKTWLPENDDVLSRGIAATDIDPQAKSLPYEEQYRLITVERVWDALNSFCSKIAIES